MNLDAVLKVGGSLSRGNGLNTLCEEINRLGKERSLLVIPGGGDFADQVRKADRRYHLEQTAAHNMALLAMDQYGYVLHHLMRDCRLTHDLDIACTKAMSGETSILLPATIMMREDPLPHSWHVTSDSIAAWIAARIGCARLILLKDVDGLLNPNGIIAEMTCAQLKEHSGGVDEYLSRALGESSVEAWIVNGMQPGRLTELLRTGHTMGTHIRASSSP